jgi:hypothetical protein
LKTLRLVLIVLVSSLFVFVSNCTPATSTPTGTINAWLDAMAARNPQALISHESEDYGGLTSAQRVGMYESAFEGTKSYSVTNRNLTVESETETASTVSVGFDLLVTDINDETWDNTVGVTYVLTKVGDKWLISEGTETSEIDTRKIEKANIESATTALMEENERTTIPNPHNVAGGVAFKDMAAFPDNTSACTVDKVNDPTDTAYTANDKDGYILYSHDKTADGSSSAGLVNYIHMPDTIYYYTCEADGTIRLWSDAAMTTEYTD